MYLLYTACDVYVPPLGIVSPKNFMKIQKVNELLIVPPSKKYLQFYMYFTILYIYHLLINTNENCIFKMFKKKI